MDLENTPNLHSAVMGDHCHLRIPSRPEWIAPTADYLISRALSVGAIDESQMTKLGIALNEALTNAIIHGNLGISSELKETGDDSFFRAIAERLSDPTRASRFVDIQAKYDGHVLRWSIHDQGAGFDTVTAMNKLDEEPDPFKPSGRGLLLMRAFTDGMHYEDAGRKVLLTVRQTDERRRLPRWSVAEPLRVTPLDEQNENGSDFGAVAHNVSAGGLGFIAESLPPSSRVRLLIPGDCPVEVIAEVRHWQPIEGNMVEVGCRFETPIEWQSGSNVPRAPDRLMSLLDRLSAKDLEVDERRTSPRLAYSGRVEVILPSGEVRRGMGRDLSRGGVAFLSAGAMPLEVVKMRLWAGDGEPIVLRAQVVRATRLVDDFYDVGARFLS